MRRATRVICLLLAVCLALSLAACGGNDQQAVASTMRLRRTEGQVDVSDQEKAVPIVADMLLYSGYRLATRLASYGWIALDETKLTKMDESSDVSVQQQGKDLELTVNAGSLFFLVTQPLAEDETFTIRCSDMVTGIRGTCGWVHTLDGEHMDVYILEGQVECSVGEPGSEQTVALPAGQVARLSTADGEQPIVTEPFTREDVPAFIVTEAEADSELAARVLAGSGIDLLTSPAFSEDEPEPSPGPTPEPTAAAPTPEPTPITDGDRTVLQGTVGSYSAGELLALQGMADAPGFSDMAANDPNTYWVIVLDQPTTLSGTQDAEQVTMEAAMIRAEDPAGLEGYAGQHVVFSVGPDALWWPSDVSLPAGEPRTNDIRILSAGDTAQAPAADQTAAPATGIAAYDAILADYMRLLQLSDDEFPAAVEQVQNVDRRILERCRMDPASSHMCYALADMNGDGVDELFMGESYAISGTPLHQIYEVLLFDGQNAVRVISEESGQASFVTPYSDGILTTENYGVASFWRINDAGTALESVPATDELTATHPTVISTPEEQAPVAPLALDWVVLPVS